ncbi:hypothetical protein BDW72DRAFT_186100 [Aspergillus terricola var. indicus]
MAINKEENTAIELVQAPSEEQGTGNQDAEQHLLTQETENNTEQSSSPVNEKPPPNGGNGPGTTLDIESLSVWSLEFLALIVSIGTIIAIVLVLRHYDGRQQPDWQGISLNSLISWLSTLAKACLAFSLAQSMGQLKWAWFSSGSRPLSDLKVFDSASRGGTYGSLELLWRVKRHHFVAFGSLAIILALGFDPFIQNLLHYVSDSIESPWQASLLGSTSRYNVVGPNIGGDFHYVDPVLKANVYNSLLNINSAENWAIPAYTCATGNCTWAPIATLAIRPACSDVSSQLNRTCTADSQYKDVRNCTASLGDDGPSAWYREGGSAAQAMDVSTTSATKALVYTSSLLPVIQYVLAVGSNNNSQASWDVVDSVNNSTQFIATECALELVIRSVQADITEGTYRETTLAEWSELQTPNGTFNDYEVVLFPPWNQSLGLAAANKTFGIGFEAWNSISHFLDTIFTGSAYAASGIFGFSASSGSYATSDTLEALFYSDFNKTTSTSTKANSTDSTENGIMASCTDQLSCAIGNVAAAMSKTFRDTAIIGSGSGGDQSLVKGQTMIIVPFVEVHWEWLVLPLLVWVLTCLVWLAAVLKTRRGRIYKWANNPLPLLYLYNQRCKDGDLVVEGTGTERAGKTTPFEWTETALDRRAEMTKSRLYTHGRDITLCE